jgi:hypothetical protein
MTSKPVESEQESSARFAHEDVKMNTASNFRADGHHRATILQHRDGYEFPCVEWHQQDSRVEEARCG